MTLTRNRGLHPATQRIIDDALGVTVVYLGFNMITPVPLAIGIGAWLLLTAVGMAGHGTAIEKLRKRMTNHDR